MMLKEQPWPVMPSSHLVSLIVKIFATPEFIEFCCFINNIFFGDNGRQLDRLDSFLC